MPARGFIFIALSLGAALFAGEPARAAAPALRYTTVFREVVDGRESKGSMTELALAEELLRAGIKLLDDAQARKIRSVTDAGTLIAGAVPEVITSLDADIIIAGVATISKIESEMLGEKAARYEATVQVKAIAVDTGEILVALALTESAFDFRVDKAARTAAEKVGRSLSKTILEKVPKELVPAEIELDVSGIPNVARVEALADSIRRLPRVKNVSVAQAGRGMSKLSVSFEAGARELALGLEETPGLGLTVFGYTPRAIKAEFTPSRAVRIRLISSRLEERTASSRREKRRAWEGIALAKVLETSLSDCDYFAIEENQSILELDRAPASWRAALARHNIRADNAVVLFGSFRRTKGDVEVEARLAAASSGALLVAKQRSCKDEALGACVAELGRELALESPEKIDEHGRLFKGFTRPEARSAIAASDVRPLELDDIEVSDVFPAELARYGERGIGTLRIRNRGSAPLTRVILSTHIAGLMRGPLDTPLPEVAPDSSIEAPIRVVFDRDALFEQDDQRPVVLTVKVSAAAGEYRVEQTESRGVIAYGRNALSWRDPESIASFVTPEESEIVRLAKMAHSAIAESERSPPLALPVALFALMKNMRYSPDPAHPYGESAVDYIQYPLQTLAVGGGDCDDLTVLFAAFSEAMNVESLLVTTPGHIFVAVSSGFPARNAGELSSSPQRILVHRDLAFIPVETSRAGATFLEAWSEAAAELSALQDSGGKPGIIELRAAWSRHAPISLVKPKSEAKIDQTGLAAEIARGLELVDQYRRAELETALARERVLSRRGMLLALLGRLEEAAAVLAEAQKSAPVSPSVLNNLGNLELIQGRADKALQRYRSVLEQQPGNVEVHINAAIAAWVLGDEDTFGEHIADCLAARGARAVEELAKSGLVPSGRAGANSPPADPKLAVRRFIYWL